MRILPRLVVAATASAAAATALIAPTGTASAAPSADTTVTFLVAGSGLGDLSISSLLPVAALADITSSSASGLLPAVSVIDTRNSAPRSWTASASTTDFTGGVLTNGVTIGKDKVTYTAGQPGLKLGAGTLASTGPQNLATTQPIVTRTGLNLLAETITWIPTLSIALPAANGGLPLDTYTGTVTVSVA